MLTTITRYALLAAAAMAALLPAVGFTADDQATATAGEEVKPVKIERICWLIHPVCWSMHGGGIPAGYLDATGLKAEDFMYSLEWERRVNQEQKRFMDNMKPNEVLIVYPISSCKAMLDLERHAQKTLGRRCLIMRRGPVAAPKVLNEMADPIRHFLEDEEMEGRDAFWNQAPKEIQDELRVEIRHACEATGYDWNPGALKVIIYNRMLAYDIRNMLAERKLIYDPATIKGMAFGEGFEQCAMTWKSLIPDYLGWANPIENDFELSVSGAPVLFDAKVREYVKLSGNVRLFLWEKADGRVMGLYFKAASRFADPQLFAHVRLDGMSLEAWGVIKKRWPADDSPLSVEHGEDTYLKVPVFASLRKDPADGSYYLIARDISFEAFRQRLVEARIDP